MIDEQVAVIYMGWAFIHLDTKLSVIKSSIKISSFYFLLEDITKLQLTIYPETKCLM